MKKAILIISLVMLLAANLPGQSTKRKRPTAKAAIDAQIESPCGVRRSLREKYDEISVEWREIGDTKEATYYYNTLKVICEKGILKAWIKSAQKDTGKPLAYSLTRYELNCHSNQLRATSTVHYEKDGTLLDSFTPKNPAWDDLVPDSIGEHIWQTVCHRSL